ncbi:DUF2779 domain-containing protein [Mycoplasma todarodis]|uniref:DUF2779 domain-containing protein n=1 Tax=Mycoplasma todarodis TaxID=1937191 RepID=A0A4R0XSF8_9MOLU|nr:DUF2779 domain-containing protein [Mycoplasma todarodis]TCG11809.1 hypothetical protein C4B25_00630 [Mycoplasma todarodis]
MEKIEEKITFAKLKKLLTCQPYFVWHSIDDLGFDKNEDDNDQFTFQIPGIIDIIAPTITEVQTKTFHRVNREFFEYVRSMGRAAWTPKMMSMEERAEETKKMMRNPGIDIIFEPVFQYGDAFAVPTLYDKKNKKISNLKISSSTKRIDLVKPYFDYQIADKCKVPVNEISYFVLDTKKYKAFEIGFYETFKVNTSSTARNDKNAKEHNDFVTMRKKKTGNGVNKKGVHDEQHTIFDIVACATPFGPKKNPIMFEGIDYYLRLIREAKTASFQDGLTPEDNGKFGANPMVSTIIEYLHPEFMGYNGKFVKKKDIQEGKTLQEIAKDSVLVDALINRSLSITDRDDAMSYIDKLDNSRVIWYDFEGFSLPFPTIDGFNPFQQATFQVSIIETNKMEETSGINHIFDPKTFSYTDFPKMIDLIYSGGADYYVVFNAGYENPRMLEMVATLRDMNYPGWTEVQDKVYWIIERTVDLAKPFAAGSKDSLPVIFIPELKGKHSIKLIEKYITKHKYWFKDMIKPYKDLTIQNGGMAMDAAIQRAINVIGDEEWTEKQVVLKEYCENDVRAMIMVYTLIKELLNDTK